MAWNAGLPGNNQKIRELGQVITPNWEAIEEGDDVGVDNMLKMRSVQLSNRNTTAGNDDPVTKDGTHYLYSKDDMGSSVKQEAFMEDSDGNVVQLTNDGGLGGKDVRLNFNDLTNDDGTTVYDERNLVGYWATVNAAGVIQAQSGGLTVSKGPLGHYTIEFVDPQSGVNYGVLISLEHTFSNATISSYSLKTVNDFVVRIVNQSGTSTNLPFTVSILGGRPT